MLGSEAAPQAVAQLFFQPGETQAGLVVSGLPPLPENRAYQLWFVHPDETRYDGGVFNVDAGGQAMVVIDAPCRLRPWLALRRHRRAGRRQPHADRTKRDARLLHGLRLVAAHRSSSRRASESE